MKIVFRADASLRIGSGHVMRCLSLADALRAQGDTSLFLCRAWPGHLGATIRAHGHALHLLPAPAEEDATSMLSALTDAEACLQLLANEGVIDCLLLDHYALDPRWLRAVRASGRCRQLLVIDDLAEHAYADEADILLDPNLGALKRRTRQLTPLRPTTNAATHPGRHLPNTTCRYLLGPRFALLRPEFSSLREATLARRLNSKPGVKAASETKRLLVFLGGGQTDALSLSVLNAIRASGIAQSSAHNNPWQIDLVLGGQAEGAAAAATRAQIEAQRHDWPQLRLHAMTPQMAQLMAQADLMIGAGGGPSWERCCLGLPALILSIAENQIDNAQQLARQRAAFYLGAVSANKPSAKLMQALAKLLCQISQRPRLLARMALRASRLTSGLGAQFLALLLHADALALRVAEPSDSALVWRWRNDERTRHTALNQDAIDFAAHTQWYRQVLANPEQFLLIGHILGRAIGVLRYDLRRLSESQTEAEATVSLYLDPELHALGFGTRLLRLACLWLSTQAPYVKRLVAVIRSSNQASRSAFARAGFSQSLEHTSERQDVDEIEHWFWQRT